MRNAFAAPFVLLLLSGAVSGLVWAAPAQAAASDSDDASMQKVKSAMADLQAKAAKLGPVKLDGTDAVAGKQVPVLFFGNQKINNDFTLVDAVQKDAGGTATIFVKSGEDFVRVSTNVHKPDGSRAVGTMLDPAGPAIAAIKQNSDQTE